MMYSPFSEEASIKLLYYCDDGHLFSDRFIIGKNHFVTTYQVKL